MIMRNSVILVDQIARTWTPARRVDRIVESAVRRFRPIWLTAAAVLAMIPLCAACSAGRWPSP